MAPNECVTLLQRDATQQQVQVKISTADDSSDEHEFFDASSEIHSDDDSLSANNKDSGVEADKEPDFIAPDADTVARIIEQVEFYFSDEHLMKDAFLLKHVRRNKEGYISLKLISSFKKVKHVTRDWRIVAFACRSSAKLQVNEPGTKVRRLDPVPELDETTPSRTVVAIGIPAEKATVETMAELFSAYGSVVLIRILRPGGTIPADVRQCANRNPELLLSYCAVVEFEQAECARAATVVDASDWRAAIRIIELAPSRTKKSTPPEAEQQGKQERRKRRGGKASASPASGNDTPTWSSSDAEDKSPFIRRKDMIRSPISLSQGSTPCGSPNQQRNLNFRNNGSLASSPEVRHRQKSHSYTEPSGQPGTRSPWVQRRMAAASGADSGRSSPANRLTLPSNVLRLPYGPDGTRGFHLRCKPRSASAPEVPALCVEPVV